ncbi:MAG TPA: Crp/Fnr family transcriptional regulator [Rhodocyclaceae bacterium]|nr:Crp/Fnr family transcriptional regulator [Rhodocyclaceae bacterium]
MISKEFSNQAANFPEAAAGACCLDRETLACCGHDGREVRVAKGEPLFSRGEPNGGLYLIRRGEIRVVMVSAQGIEYTLEILKPGQTLGESCLVGEPLHAESALAVSDSLLVYLPKELLLEEFRRTPALRFRLLAVLSERLQGRMAALGAGASGTAASPTRPSSVPPSPAARCR